MKNRTIAKLLVCSTILANLPVAAMANEVQQLANDTWYLDAESDGNNGYVYNVGEDSKVLWFGENKTYSIEADVAVKIDAGKSVALGSNLENEGNNQITIEGNGTTSVFNMENDGEIYAINSDVTFKNVAVNNFTDTKENRAKVTIEGTVDINGEAVVTVTGADDANVAVTNENGNFANGVGFALVGDTLTITPAEGYTVTVTGAEATEVENQYTVTGAVTITATKEELADEYEPYQVNVTGAEGYDVVANAEYAIGADATLDYKKLNSDGTFGAKVNSQVTVRIKIPDGMKVADVNGLGVDSGTTKIENGYCYYSFIVTEPEVEGRHVTFTLEEQEAEVWVKDEATGDWILSPEYTEGSVATGTDGGNYVIQGAANLTKVTITPGTKLTIANGVTFTNDIDFVVGGRLVAQTTNFQGKVWFSAYTGTTRATTLAAEGGTVELDGAIFNEKVTIFVPTTTTAGAGETKFNGGAQVDAALTVAGGSTLEIASDVSGTGSIASEGTLNVTSGTVKTAIAVNGGTTTVAENATVGEVNVTAGSATVNGTASKVTVADGATVTVGEGAKVGVIDAENPDNVVGAVQKFGVKFIGENGTLKYTYNGTESQPIANNGEVYLLTTDTEIKDVTFVATPDDGFKLDAMTIDGQPYESGSPYTIAGDVTVKALFTAIEEPVVPEDSVSYTVNIGEGGSVTYQLAGDAEVKTLTSGSVNLFKGEDYTLKVTANEGYEIDTVTVDGTPLTGTDGTYQFTAKSEGTGSIAVTFKQTTPGVEQVYYAVNIGEGGSVTYNKQGSTDKRPLTGDYGPVQLDFDSVYELHVEPDDGYEVDKVIVDGQELSATTDGAYSFRTVRTGTIQVTFKTVGGETPDTQVKYTANIGEGGSVTYQEVGSTAEAVVLKDGESVTLTKGKSYQLKVETDDNYEVDAVKVDGSAVEKKDNVYTFVAGETDGTIAVSFSYMGGGSIGGGGGSGSTGGGSSTSGTTSTVTVSASTSVSGKIMTATVSASNMEKAIKEVLALAEKNDTTPVVKVSLSVNSTVDGISVNLPTEALKALAAVSNAKLTIESSVASVTFDAKALSDILSQAGETFTLNAGKADMSDFTAAQLLGAGEGSVFDINITSDGNAITNFSNGTATVTLPYTLKSGENASDIVVYYMADNGILDSQSTQYDAANRKATFTTTHFSIYVVDSAWANPFNDVTEGAWFYNAVRYANENSLMAGVSDTTFAPNMNLTRAMVVQMLYSLEGKPAVVSGSNFADVKAGDWYADAVNWAASKGIVSGYSETTYAPNDSVTREQLSLILYKYAQSKGVTVNDYSSLSGFVDGAKTSDWAEDAVEWAVGAGLISSTSTDIKTLEPNGTATRAQVAQIFANFVEQVM